MMLKVFMLLIIEASVFRVYATINYDATHSETFETCPHICIVSRDPVCGTDGQTYDNECLLRKATCQSNYTIDLAYKGACDLCRNFTCQSPPYSVCMASNNVRNCTCTMSACPTVDQPVCGSDGRTYSNDCKLRQHACITRAHIAVTEFGSCPDSAGEVDHLITIILSGRAEKGGATSCASVQCPFPSTCKEKPGSGRPECVTVCPKVCPLPQKPVCGSDGRTYENECELWRAKCNRKAGTKAQLYVVKHDPCPVPDCPFICSPGSVCQVIDGTAQCVQVCRHSCPDVFEPVCGSDGITYSNQCELEHEACTRGNELTVAHKGSCKDPCVNYTCSSPPHSICEVKNGHAACECSFDCPDEQELVCGSDGKIYDHPCRLEEVACRGNRTITVASKALCSDPCLTAPSCIDLRPYAKCRAIDGVAKCVCTDLCNEDTIEPVCGTDGISYSSECKLKTAACQQNKTNEIFSTGSCRDPCQFTLCSHYAYCVASGNIAKCTCPRLCPDIVKHVCGSDGVTYSSECKLRVASCANKTLITVASTGPCAARENPCSNTKCDNYATCTVIGSSAECVCPSACPPTFVPVCGSDGQTYDNECLMKVESCAGQRQITVMHVGGCAE